MLIRNAEIDGERRDVRLESGHIASIGTLVPVDGEAVLDAGGGALIPGIWDHHIHLNAMAAAFSSVVCGPPDVLNAEQFHQALMAAPGGGWLRGIGYHESVAGEIDRRWLDRHGPDRPVRVQHRSGRLWMFNSLACAELGDGVPANGRLLDDDKLVHNRLALVPPDLAAVGRALAARGVTGVTDATARTSRADLARYATARLPQRLRIMGSADLDRAGPLVGERKFHHHDHDLPPLATLVTDIAAAHGAGRSVAFHCVTPAELVLALAAIEEAGPMRGDRIEHAAVAPAPLVEWMARLGLVAVTQPHFLVERQGSYRTDVEAEDRPWLYRLRGLASAGVGIAGGSDAPFGSPDPWLAMAAAVDRTYGFGEDECLTPEQALALYTGSGHAPCEQRLVAPGAVADLCIIDRSWWAARVSLKDVRVRATLVGAAIVYDAMASIRPQSNA
jgi:predicted amidohydrolase YtcJ